jgi:hypothetical protein
MHDIMGIDKFEQIFGQQYFELVPIDHQLGGLGFIFFIKRFKGEHQFDSGALNWLSNSAGMLFLI